MMTRSDMTGFRVRCFQVTCNVVRKSLLSSTIAFPSFCPRCLNKRKNCWCISSNQQRLQVQKIRIFIYQHIQELKKRCCRKTDDIIIITLNLSHQNSTKSLHSTRFVSEKEKHTRTEEESHLDGKTSSTIDTFPALDVCFENMSWVICKIDERAFVYGSNNEKGGQFQSRRQRQKRT